MAITPPITPRSQTRHLIQEEVKRMETFCAGLQKKSEELAVTVRQVGEAAEEGRPDESERLTLLVDVHTLTRTTDEYGSLQMQRASQAYALKWTGGLELASSRLYDEVTKTLATAAPFHLPKTIAFGEQSVDLRQESLPIPEDALPKYGTLKKMIQAVQDHFRFRAHPTWLIRSEKLQAENFGEFLAQRYSTLDPCEKQSLWRRVGRLALLDLVLGHTDRLAQVRPSDDESGALEFSEWSNLSNVMARCEGSQCSLFLIDNELNCTSPENYLTFLTAATSSPTFFEDFAEILKNSLLNGLEEIRGSQVCCKELRTTSLPFLMNGIETMFQALKTELLSPNAKTHIDAIEPGLTEIVLSRLQVIEKAKTTPKTSAPRQNAAPQLSASDLCVQAIIRESLTPTSPGFQRIVTPLREENPLRDKLYQLVRDLQHQMRDLQHKTQPDPVLLKALQEALKEALEAAQKAPVQGTSSSEELAPSPTYRAASAAAATAAAAAATAPSPFSPGFDPTAIGSFRGPLLGDFLDLPPLLSTKNS